MVPALMFTMFIFIYKYIFIKSFFFYLLSISYIY